MISPFFLNIGASEDVPLNNLTPSGDSTSWNIVVQTLSSGGKTVGDYIWCNVWGDDCWCDQNNDYAPVDDSVVFPFGQGLWVYGSEVEAGKSQGLQCSGKVGVVDITSKLRAGATALGNPFPVDVKLNDILPSGDSTSWNIVVQTLSSGGKTVGDYIWCNVWGEDCWCDQNNDYAPVGDSVVFKPGEGLWVYGSAVEEGQAQYITIPAPEGL